MVARILSSWAAAVPAKAATATTVNVVNPSILGRVK